MKLIRLLRKRLTRHSRFAVAVRRWLASIPNVSPWDDKLHEQYMAYAKLTTRRYMKLKSLADKWGLQP